METERPHPAHHAHHDHPGHAHAHARDRGLAGFLRYARILPRMWRSEVSRAVVDEIAPRPGEEVVDLGAGMGPATVEAARRGASVVAVDPSAYMRFLCDARRRLRLAAGLIGADYCEI